MTCAWKELLSILPLWLRQEVDRLESLQELRLRLGRPVEWITAQKIGYIDREVRREDLQFCVNTASRYSPWTASTVVKGYLTAPGGHRIGLCGEVACRDGEIQTIREIHALNIRVARDFPGIARTIPTTGSVLIIGPPGWGKTTLLRDLAREIAKRETVSVVDERGELFPPGFERGNRMDVMLGCPKAEGIDMVLRSMGPAWIALDEITSSEDTAALLHSVGCGVQLLATAHGSSVADLRSRSVYKPIWDNRIFQTVLVMNRDKTFYTERTCL